jgi:hypothetical protein
MATFRLLLGLLLGVLLIGGTAMAQPPMHGTYTIGDDPEDSYASFIAASAALTANTVDGPVTFDVEQLTYSGRVFIYSITGASAINTITFRDAGALDTPPKITSAQSAALTLNGADYITFDGIDVQVTVNGTVVSILGNADYNTIKNCTLTGALETSVLNKGVSVSGGGNDYNLIENVSVNGTLCYGVYLLGALGASDQGNEVRNCTFIGGQNSVYLKYQNGTTVHDCDLQPGYNASTAQDVGIYVASLTVGELCTAYRNKIHNIRGSRIIAAINAATGSPGGTFKAYNNFVYDYVVTGGAFGLNGFMAGPGTAEFYFNSVYVGDVATTTGPISGFYLTNNTWVVLKNNIFQIDDPTAACYAINQNAGTITASDYNCVYGTGAAYSMGRVGLTNYPTLALWQTATSLDSHSVEGNPGFVSATDLHINTAYALVDAAGTPIAGITNDIDGDPRGTPPDIGGDEYTPVGHDFGVIGFVGLLPEYVYETPYTIQADVQNNGVFNETNVPVRLYYDGVLQSTVLVTLDAGIRDTIDLAWTTPDTGYAVDTLEVQAFCPHDGTPANDSALASVTVVGPPEEVDSLTVYPDSLASDAVLNWAAAARANSYMVYRGTDYEFVLDGTTYIGQTAGTSYTDVGVLATTGNKYYVVIASTDSIARGR